MIHEILSSRLDLQRKGVIPVEAEQILIHAYESTQKRRLNRMELFSRMQDRLPETAAERAIILAGARVQGKLLQHLTGTQNFFGREYRVNNHVLVPRPETEILVQTAIEELAQPSVGLEVGLGSGIISIELLLRFRNLKMIASEFSDEAIKVALGNLDMILGKSGTKRLKIRKPFAPDVVSDVFSEVKDADFLISNPPYLLPEEAEEEVRDQEPALALFAPKDDPIFFYRRIAAEVRNHIKKDGKVFLEIPHERAKTIQIEFQKNGFHVKIVNDLAGRPRVLVANG